MPSLPCHIGDHDDCPCNDIDGAGNYYYLNSTLCTCDCHNYTENFKIEAGKKLHELRKSD